MTRVQLFFFLYIYFPVIFLSFFSPTSAHDITSSVDLTCNEKESLTRNGKRFFFLFLFFIQKLYIYARFPDIGHRETRPGEWIFFSSFFIFFCACFYLFARFVLAQVANSRDVWRSATWRRAQDGGMKTIYPNYLHRARKLVFRTNKLQLIRNYNVPRQRSVCRSAAFLPGKRIARVFMFICTYTGAHSFCLVTMIITIGRKLVEWKNKQY